MRLDALSAGGVDPAIVSGVVVALEELLDVLTGIAIHVAVHQTLAERLPK